MEGCVEEEELTETVLADGESRLEFLGGYTGDSERPLPKILPPPSFRADIVPSNFVSHEDDIEARHVRLHKGRRMPYRAKTGKG